MRYQVHDSQAHTPSHMRPKSTVINPRYWVIDTATGTTVDEATTKREATAIARQLESERQETT